MHKGEYQLILRLDSNSTTHQQWFHFTVQNTTETRVRFHILNFTKPFSLYSKGMQPVVWS